MINLNEEYFQSPYYFYLKNKGNKIAVYFSVGETLSESRKNDDVVVVDKEIFKDIQKIITKILNSGKKLSKEYVHKLLDSKSNSTEKPEGEIDELVNPDGSFISSNTPILNQRNLAKKTMDQTVRMTRSNQFPFFRTYWGESKENNLNKLLDETDQSESFGFEETEDASTYDEANEIFKDELGVKDDCEREERVRRLGFDKNLDKQLKQEKKRGICKNCFTKRRLSELEKQKMETLIDEILLSKKNISKDVVKKTKENNELNQSMEKILIRNIESIKKLANKEGVDINKLVKHLKTGE
jgi:hypothetical protein